MSLSPKPISRYNNMKQNVASRKSTLYCPTETEKLCTSTQLYFPCNSIFKVILVGPILVWIICIMLGSFHHEGVSSTKVEHPFVIYDKYILRRFGSLLPFCFLFLRWFFNFPWIKRIPRTTPGSRPTFSAQATLCFASFILYGKMALLRLVLYWAHIVLQRYTKFVVMSDHVFLGACICACLQVEVALAIGDVIKNEALRGPAARSLLIIAVMMFNLLIQFITAADLYFSGRHYHHTREINASLFAGLMLFQVQGVLWLKRQLHAKANQNL